MGNQSSKTYTESLIELRNKIDAIDDEIISALQKRMAIIDEVAHLKKEHQISFFIRSNREADMIKNLVKKSQNFISPTTTISIWRKIITAANMHEQSLKIAIHNPQNLSDYEFLAREYYSSDVPMQNFDSVSSVVQEIEKKEAQIAIFSLPSEQNEEIKTSNLENWWIALANNKLGLRVFAALPFLHSQISHSQQAKFQHKLVAMAVKEAEKSDSDNSLFYLEVSKDFSKSQVASTLQEFGFAAKILKSVKLNQVDGIHFYLVEVEGFYLEEDQKIKDFSKSKIRPFVKVLGNYPTQINQ